MKRLVLVSLIISFTFSNSLLSQVPIISAIVPDSGKPGSVISIVGSNLENTQMVNFQSDYSKTLDFFAHNNSVYGTAFSPDDATIASSGFDGTIKLWNSVDGSLIRTLTGHNNLIYSIAFSPDGTEIASASVDQTIKLWNVNDGTLIRTIYGHNDQVYSVAFSPDGTKLASGSNNFIKIWNVNDGSIIQTISAHDSWVFGLKFSPDGSMLASASQDYTIKLWDTNTWSLIRTLVGHTYIARSVAFTSDNEYLVSGGDETVRLWRISDGNLIRTFSGHQSNVMSVVISPEDSVIASASEDQTVKLWRLGSGNNIATLSGYTNIVWSVAINSNGTRLVSGSNDQTVKVWRLREQANFNINSGTIYATVPPKADTGFVIIKTPFGITESPQIFKTLRPTLLNVPADYPTIQEAINASVNGDTVLVAPGTYQENINFYLKEILVTSNALFDRDTNIVNQTKIVSTNYLQAVVVIGAGSKGKILGFSIQGGNGGIATGTYSYPKIDFCKIYGSIGSGINCGDSYFEVTDCDISNNMGAGITTLGATGLVKRSKIYNNIGPGITLWEITFNIENCLIYNNGAGISNRGSNPTTITNTTFWGNNSGIVCIEGSAFTISNSIIYATGTPINLNSGGIHILNIDYTIIENGLNGIINIPITSQINYGTHNVDYDPKYVDSLNNNYRLSEYSPALGSGTSAGAPLTDIEGNPRPNPSGTNPDIGAYESSLAHFNLLPPVLSSVLDGALNQPITVPLKWDSVYAATSYRFQFSTDSTFQTTLIDQSNVADTFFNVSSLNYLTKYYWRVNATYPYDTSDWSETWNFKTIIETPETPTLLAPSDNSFNLTTDLNFTWNSSLRAEKYEFQLATDTLFQNIVVLDTSIVGTSRVVTGLSYDVKYFWKVRAKNIGGNSSFSSVWNFRTKLQTPTPQSPANNSQNVTINPTLTWSTVAGAANYHLQIALDPTFNQIVINDSLLTNASVQVGPLLNSTAYYWRVKGYNGIYTSNFSVSFNFTTIISNPNFPVLLSPGNGSVNQPLNTTFTWEPVASATAYKLQVSTDSLFGSFIINDSSITTTSKFVNLPNSNQKYFWRVQANNVGGNSPFSSEWYLITVLPAPSLTSINAGNKTVQLNWNQLPLSNLLLNNIYRDVTPNPTQLVSSVPFNQTSFTDTSLTNGVTYYYRVKTLSVFSVESEYSNQLSAAPHNSPPVAAVLNSLSFPDEGRVLTREVSFSNAGSFDPDGSIDSTKWYVNDEFISYGNNLTYPFSQGTHSVKLVVIDNDGESDTSSTTVTRSMFTKNVNGQVVAGLSLIGSNILYAIVNGDAIYRMDKDGNIDYTLQVGGNLLSSSSIANDSTVYIGSTDNNIYAFSKNGTSLWVRPLGGAVTTTPTIDILNDRVYVGVSNRNFQFLNRSNGNVLGNYFSDSPINTSAVITTDNRLFFSTVKGTMYGFDLASISFPNVIPTWTITSSDTISSSPAIDAEGFFYVGTKNGLLKKISMQSGLQGTVVWQANLGGIITASPVIDASGNIYVGSSNNNFYAIDRMNGSIKWSYPFGGQIKTTAAISDNANIYFGTINGYIYCIDTLGTTLWQYEDSSSICSSLLYSDGVLYLGTLDGTLVALYDQVVTESTTLLANNIWGTFQGNNQRTGEQADRLTSIKEEDYSSNPTEYTVFDNFPNPFNPSTIIRYALPFHSKVKIEVYNIIGELIKELADLEQAPGFYDVTFDAEGLSSGIYIYRIVAQSTDNQNKFSQVKKMILLK